MIYFLIFLLLLISLIDIKTKTIPDWIIAIGMITGIVLNGWSALLGIIIGIFFVHLLNTFNITHLGGGDYKLIGMIGAFLGWKVVFVLVLYLLFSFFLKHRYKRIIASPFISLAALMVMFL